MKKLIMLLLVLSSILLVGCTEGYVIIDYKVLELDIENIEYIRCFEYGSSTIQGNCYIIHNVKELETIHRNNDSIKEHFDMYDKNFFKNNSLVLVGVFEKYNYKYNVSAIKNGVVGINSEKNGDIIENIKLIIFIEAEGKVKKNYTTIISREYIPDDYQNMLSDYS